MSGWGERVRIPEKTEVGHDRRSVGRKHGRWIIEYPMRTQCEIQVTRREGKPRIKAIGGRAYDRMLGIYRGRSGARGGI